MRCNFGEMIFLQIMLELGIPCNAIPNGLIKKWNINDNTKQQRRFYSTQQYVKDRRKYRHRTRKHDNKNKRKKYHPTRREKEEPLKT